MISLNTQPGQRIIELGGGANPLVHPNVDARQCYDAQGRPTVDFTADFNAPLPIQSDEWDGVVSVFALEHVSWRKVPDFLREVIRIIKPGGKFVCVIPNTEAQLKWIEKNPTGWDEKSSFDSCSCILYGDQDYPENSHRSYFSPDIVTKLFSEVGFSNILVRPYGERATDMCIECAKPEGSPVQASSPQTGSNTIEAMVGKHIMTFYGEQICPVVCPEMIRGNYETYESKLIQEYIKPGDTVLDIGAHIGYYSLILADAVGPEGKVVCFEPEPNNFILLDHNLRKNGYMDRVHLRQHGLSDHKGSVEFSMNPYNTGDLRPWVIQEDGWTKKHMEVDRLDDIIDPSSRTSLIKLDIQGGEIKALRGMQELFKEQTKLVVFTEFWPYGIKWAGGTIEEFLSFFEGFQGFNIQEKEKQIVPITDWNSLVEPNTDQFTNILFIK